MAVARESWRGGERLPWSLLLSYGALGLPLAALNLPLYVLLPPYYAAELGLGLSTVGLVLFVAALLDTVTDPVIGELSDRVSTRFGRRRPWIVVAAPLLMVSTVMLFVPEPGVGGGYLLLWSSVAYVAWTLILLPYTAWGAELSPHYHERTRITGAREGFVIAGILIATGLPTLLGTDGDDGKTLAVLAWSMVALVPVCVLALLLRVPDPPVAPEPPLSPRRGLLIAWRNHPFRQLVIAYFLNAFANAMPATLFILFVEHVLSVPEQSGRLLFLYFLFSVASVPFWLWLSAHGSKHRAWIVSLALACVAFAFVPAVGGDLRVFYVLICLAGFSLGGDMVLPASMQADVVDLDRLESGRKRAGLFFALWSMTTKLSLALAVGVAFPVLDVVGFDAQSADNSRLALFTLTALYAFLPVVMKLIVAHVIWDFPIDAARHEALRAALAARRRPVR